MTPQLWGGKPFSTYLLYGIHVLLTAIHPALADGNAHIGQELAGCEWASDTLWQGGISACLPSNDDALLDLDDLSDFSPWTHRPFCIPPGPDVESDYCVFTAATFNRNRGLSVVATAERAQSVGEQLAGHLTDLDELIDYGEQHVLGGSSTRAYEVRNVGEKGMGVVATRAIRKGEVLMRDPAVMMVQMNAPSGTSREESLSLINRAVGQLPNPQIVLDLSSASKFNESLVENILRTNVFEVVKDMIALFTEISRINHSCKPNAFVRFNQQTLSMRAEASHDIAAGEEITVSYPVLGMASPQRREQLRKAWGFDCACDLCAAPPDVVAESDRRREEVTRLYNLIVQASNENRHEEAIKMAHEALELLRLEDLEPLFVDQLENLTKLYFTIGDKEKALEYGEWGLRVLKRYGTEGEERTQKLEDFLLQLKLMLSQAL